MSFNSARTVRFGDLLSEPVRNGIYKQKQFHGRGCKIINMGELFGHPRLNDVPMKRVELSEKEQTKSLVQEGDLLFARRSLVAEGAGKCSIVKSVKEHTTFESSIIRARPDSRLVSSDFLYYYFASSQGREQMRTILRQVAVSGITGSDLMELQVPCPDLGLQASISQFLSGIDDLIALLRETNATLESIAQALFKSWFVDFDPVRAKMEGRVPEGMDEARAGLFPDSFEESELGLGPRGWKIGNYRDLARLHKGTVNPGMHGDVVFQHFSLPAFDDGQMPIMEYGSSIKSNKTSVPENAVLLSKLNPHIPRVWLPSCVDENAVCSTEFLPFVPVGPSTTSFVYCLLNAPDSSAALCKLVTGTSNSHQRVKPDGVLSLRAVVPPSNIVDVFDTVACGLLNRMRHNRIQAQTLATLRDTLLPRLISGQLRLS